MKNFDNFLILEIALIGTAITSCLSDHYILYILLGRVMGEFNVNFFIKSIPFVCCFIALIVPMVLIYRNGRSG